MGTENAEEGQGSAVKLRMGVCVLRTTGDIEGL